MTPEENQKFVGEDPLAAQQRAIACAKELDALMTKYRCKLDIQLNLSPLRGITSKIAVIPIFDMPPGLMPNTNPPGMN